MDLMQNFEDYAIDHRNVEDVTIKKRCESQLAKTIESEDNNGSFDCNICFDSAHEPVVTLCGHLYCWACIFKWLHVQGSSDSGSSVQHRACPVCKANISQATLVPLYCHGPSHAESEVRMPYCDLIPPRPTTFGLHDSNQQLPSDPFHHHHHHSDRYGGYATISSSSNLVSTTAAGIINPAIVTLGELVYTRMFGSANTNLFNYPLPSSYAIMGSNNTPRMRRQELQLDKSLNRVSVFLFCCFILCLLLF